MKLSELLTEAKQPAIETSFTCQCAAYNYPNRISDLAEKALTKNGHYSAKGAALKKNFKELIDDLDKQLKNKKIQHNITKFYPDFYTDATKIEISEISIGISYTDEDRYDDEDEEENKEDNFPRAGNSGQDYVNGEFKVFGIDKSKINKKDLDNVMYCIAMEIGGLLYGQYCDDADIQVI